jgi:hypothetical protein
MRNFTLNDLKDDHGQPRQLFNVNFENNVSKAIDQLSGICAGILCDGVVNDTEAQFFADWVRRYSAYEPIWPFTNIVDRIGRIFADGTLDDDERHELRDIMSVITGQTTTPPQAGETYSSRLPLDQTPHRRSHLPTDSLRSQVDSPMAHVGRSLRRSKISAESYKTVFPLSKPIIL